VAPEGFLGGPRGKPSGASEVTLMPTTTQNFRWRYSSADRSGCEQGLLYPGLMGEKFSKEDKINLNKIFA